MEAEKSSASIAQAYRFREDSFDPVSRVRRGRFYRAEGPQPAPWYLQRHPALHREESVDSGSDITKMLDTFQGVNIWQSFIKDRKEQPLVLLGLDERYSVWTILSVEVISTGEDLVTLKARGSFGVLPDVIEAQIPEAHRTVINQRLDAFVDEVHRASPTSVIDRARDAAGQVLLAYFNSVGRNAEDLSKLADRLNDKNKLVASCAAKIIARLHARAKPSEQTRRSLPPIKEQDAELATWCLGAILCEIEWAEWP